MPPSGIEPPDPDAPDARVLQGGMARLDDNIDGESEGKGKWRRKGTGKWRRRKRWSLSLKGGREERLGGEEIPG